MANDSAALTAAASDRDALHFPATAFAPSFTLDSNESSVCKTLAWPELWLEPTPAATALHAIGALVPSVGVLLDCTTLLVLRSVRFSGRAATAPAVRLSLISLCCADVLLAVGTLIVSASNFAEQAEVSELKSLCTVPSQAEARSGALRRVFCLKAWAEDLWTVGVYANLLTLIIVASEQAAAVRWPFASERLLSTRRVALALAVAWLCSLAIGVVLPMAAVAVNVRHPAVDNYVTKGVSMLCYQRIIYGVKSETRYVSPFNQMEIDLSQVGIGVVLMALTFACLTIAYGYMFCVVRRMVSSDRKLSRRPASSSSVGPGVGGSRSEMWRGSRRVVTATFSVTALFLASYAPLLVYNAWRFFNVAPSADWLYPALFAITSVTSVSDPLVYAWRLKEIRSGFRSLIRPCQRGRQRRASTGSRGGSSSRKGAMQLERQGERDAVYQNALATPLLPPTPWRADGSTVASASVPHSQASVEGATMATYVVT